MDKDNNIEKNENILIEKRTLEELLLDLRNEKQWNYINIMEEMQKYGIQLEETQIKKWE